MSRNHFKNRYWDFRSWSNAQERNESSLTSEPYGGGEIPQSTQTQHYSDGSETVLLESYHRLPKDTKSSGQSSLITGRQTVPPAYGEPTEWKIITWKEVVFVMICGIACITAIITVASNRLAIRLGQTNQLVILGFCISVMGYFTRKSLQRLLICMESSKSGVTSENPTTLQNLDAILFCNPIADSIGWQYRPILAALLLGPIALGATYKSFSDGETSIKSMKEIDFGLTGPPGTEHIGFGLSQFVNATSDWFSDPGSNRAYGFNMFVSDYNTTAMLDGPVPTHVKPIQSNLSDGEFTDIVATVYATVCSLATLLHNTTWFDEEFESSRQGTDDHDLIAYRKFVYSTSYWYGIMLSEQDTYSTIWASWWTVNQTFGSEVKQYSLNRRLMEGRWRITRNSISLLGATFVKGHLPNLDGLSAHLAIPALFASALTEYDYTFVKYSPSRYQNITKYENEIRNDATTLAAVVWARITALHGVEVTDTTDDKIMPIYTVNTTLRSTYRTLRNERGLHILLIIQPVLMLTAIVIRFVFYMRSPVSEEFGLITILGASEPSTLGVLKGAGYSGKLRKEVPVRFCSSIGQDVAEGNAARLGDTMKISMFLGQGGGNAKVHKGVKYE